jgi:hypothetical protein
MEASCLHYSSEFTVGVVRDVFILVAAWHQPVEFFNVHPLPLRVVRRSEYQSSSWPKYATELVENWGVLGHVFDDLRAQHAGERGIGKREREPGRAHEWLAETAGVAQFPLQDVDAHTSGRQTPNDSTRPAADVQHRALARDEVHDVPKTFSLPVAL